MEVRNLKIIFNKSGDGYLSGKLSIPMTWLREMDITPEERNVNVQFDEENEQIIIKKQK